MRAIPFSEIPEQGLELELHGLDVGEAGGAEADGGVDAELRLDHGPDGRVLVRGRIRCRAGLRCDRCLDSFAVELRQDFSLVLEPVSCARGFGSEYHLEADELEVEFVEQPVVDPASIVVQQFILSLPAKRLCREDCPGLCPGCGQDLKSAACECGSGAGGPFAALAALLRDDSGKQGG